MSSITKNPKQIILWSHPRTGCNLLERMLSKQLNVKFLTQPFMASFFETRAQRQALDTLLIPDPPKLLEPFESSYRVWEDAWESCIENSKILFVHTHPNFVIDPSIEKQWISEGRYDDAERNKEWSIRPELPRTNLTVLPDELITRVHTVPVFTTRHPALLLPSALRTLLGSTQYEFGSVWPVVSFLGWNRIMYEWYISHGIKPLIVDADDYMTSSEYVRNLCAELGLDPKAAIFSWPEVTEGEKEHIPPPIQAVAKTLLHSSGVIAERSAKGLDVEQEKTKGRAEFGNERAKLLEKAFEKAMPEYLWLRERKFRGV